MLRVDRENKVLKVFESFVLGFCKCGCGKEIDNLRVKSNWHLCRWINGHHNKGNNNSRWKGYTITKRGYIAVKRFDHPFRNSKNSVLEHRLVYEHYLLILFDEVIYIPKKIDIDHEDENKQNNALINLRPMTRSEHKKIHAMKRFRK